jgi:hypothetical protein
MATLPPDRASELGRDLLAIPQGVAEGICPPRMAAAQLQWKVWSKFCSSINTDPGLSQFRDPVPVLLVFARRFRDGRIAPSGHPVRARTAEDAVRSVGQAFSSLGAPDPRLNHIGQMDFRLQRTIAGWRKLDSPPTQKKPVPRRVLLKASRLALLRGRPRDLAIMDLMWMGFFFLLRPGGYLYTTKGPSPLSAL